MTAHGPNALWETIAQRDAALARVAELKADLDETRSEHGKLANHLADQNARIRELVVELTDAKSELAIWKRRALDPEWKRLRQRALDADPRRAARIADPHAHACVSCSPDGVTPGPGCINCRQTGHEPQCPHSCCDGPDEIPYGKYPRR